MELNYQSLLRELGQAYHGLMPNLKLAASSDFYNSFEFKHLREFASDLSLPVFCKLAHRLLDEMVDCYSDSLAGAALNIAALYDVLESFSVTGPMLGDKYMTWMSVKSYASMNHLPRTNPHVSTLIRVVADIELPLLNMIFPPGSMNESS